MKEKEQNKKHSESRGSKRVIGIRKFLGYIVLTGCMTFLDYVSIVKTEEPMFSSKTYIIAFAIFCGLNIYDQNREKVNTYVKGILNGNNKG